MLTDDQIEILKNGGVGVIPTDTIYGLVGSALDPKVKGRIIKLKHASADKRLVILINQISDLEKFGIISNSHDRELLMQFWPGPVSIAFDNLYAFRLPKLVSLQKILAQTGPLFATSANISGQPPATTITEAKQCFGDQVTFYVDGGRLENPPSTLIKLDNGQIKVLRGKL